ncbi:4-alpha-glucanotransferase, partial [Streptococcus agalactiae]|nr:4-alpha-glucanotransferase [Streptococcus agalactiae]
MKKRASGVLMHITSLPGDLGIGTFGREAYAFVDFLVETDQKFWQILPLTTTSFGDSPYQSFSAVAGNTHLIDFDLLTLEGFILKDDYQNISFGQDPEVVDYAGLFEKRRPVLEKAVKNFLKEERATRMLSDFLQEEKWVTDFAEFMAIKEHFGNKALQEWDDKAIIRREEEALAGYRQKLSEVIKYHEVTQ